jgi:hypothetical protein
MKKILKTVLFFSMLSAIITSCTLFESKEKKAIEICQKAKVQLETDNTIADAFFNLYGLGTNATWLDFANMVAKKDPDKKLDWKAEPTSEKNIYLVCFVDQDGWGHRWEVDIEQKIVKFVNQNEYLCRKYGLSRFGGNKDFEVTNIRQKELKIENNYDIFGGKNSSEIVYIIKASVLNKTDKVITSATIDGNLQLIFKNKIVEENGNYSSGFKTTISENNPWKPNTEKEFFIKTKGIEKIYLNYLPEYVIFNVSLKAEDPVGYSFDKDIVEYDLKDNWKAYQNKSTDNSSDNSTTNSTDTL